jgi:para-nitrobenzyl esterase
VTGEEDEVTERSAERRTLVQTNAGAVKGTVIGSVLVFRGIPYGADTSGDGRFRPPRPARWPGVRDVVDYGHTAPQLHPGASGVPSHLAWIFDSEPRSENCLVLNIFAPLEPVDGGAPVMVFLHGGGFISGSASPPGLDGTNLARRGVVIVTINHRLNIFGHLYLGEHRGDRADSGNAGLLDILSALRWVQRNIAQFGGDPDCVTIFGQSGGGSKVAAMMAMPAARGLFHRAIIQSASSMLRFASADEATRSTEHVLNEFQLDRRRLRALHEIPVRDLLAASRRVIVAARRDDFRPVVDGFHLPDQPFAAGTLQLSSDVPLLIGWCETEQRAAYSLTPEVFQQTRSTALAKVASYLGAPADLAAIVMDTYAAQRPSDSSGDLMAMIYGDHRYRRTITAVAERRAASALAPTFLYTIRWRSPAMGGLLRSPHMMCLPFAFRNVDHAREFIGTEPDRFRLQEEISGAWVKFARTGDPGGLGVAPWPSYNLKSRATMVFDRESHLENDPASEERAVLELCAPYVPAVGEGGQRGRDEEIGAGESIRPRNETAAGPTLPWPGRGGVRSSG